MHTVGTPIELLASAARGATAGTASDPVAFPQFGWAIQFILDLTAAATDVGDTLDVYVQTDVNDVDFVDVAHFTQCLGNGGAKQRYLKIGRNTAQTAFGAADVLTAGNKRDMFGRRWRVRWVIVDAGAANASFTFSVKAVPI